jgi:hypothetical protein
MRTTTELKEIYFDLRGTQPLLMHSSALVNPRNPIVKEMKLITDKKNRKTHEESLRLEYLEWLGGLVVDSDNRPSISESQVLGLLAQAASNTRNKAKSKRAVIAATSPFFRLEYDGPKDLDDLYEEARFRDQRPARVGVGKSVIRTRARFPIGWKVRIGFLVNVQEMNVEDVVDAIEYGGGCVGIGDYRPRFGRYEVLASECAASDGGNNKRSKKKAAN